MFLKWKMKNEEAIVTLKPVKNYPKMTIFQRDEFVTFPLETNPKMSVHP